MKWATMDNTDPDQPKLEVDTTATENVESAKSEVAAGRRRRTV